MTKAPPIGVVPEFDEIDQRVKEVLERIGNPENITEEERRDKLAAAFMKHDDTGLGRALQAAQKEN